MAAVVVVEFHTHPIVPISIICSGTKKSSNYGKNAADKCIAAHKLIENTVYVYPISYGASDYPKLIKENTSIEQAARANA